AVRGREHFGLIDHATEFALRFEKVLPLTDQLLPNGRQVLTLGDECVDGILRQLVDVALRETRRSGDTSLDDGPLSKLLFQELISTRRMCPRIHPELGIDVTRLIGQRRNDRLPDGIGQAARPLRLEIARASALLRKTRLIDRERSDVPRSLTPERLTCERARVL